MEQRPKRVVLELSADKILVKCKSCMKVVNVVSIQAAEILCASSQQITSLLEVVLNDANFFVCFDCSKLLRRSMMYSSEFYPFFTCSLCARWYSLPHQYLNHAKTGSGVNDDPVFNTMITCKECIILITILYCLKKMYATGGLQRLKVVPGYDSAPADNCEPYALPSGEIKPPHTLNKEDYVQHINENIIPFATQNTSLSMNALDVLFSPKHRNDYLRTLERQSTVFEFLRKMTPHGLMYSITNRPEYVLDIPRFYFDREFIKPEHIQVSRGIESNTEDKNYMQPNCSDPISWDVLDKEDDIRHTEKPKIILSYDDTPIRPLKNAKFWYNF